MTATAQAELTDAQRAQHARAKATRVLPYEIAVAVCARLSEGIDFARFCDRRRWLRLISEVEAIPEGKPARRSKPADGDPATWIAENLSNAQEAS